MAFKQEDIKNDFSSLTISLASPESIKRRSRGEVTKPETVNYRTYKPERDGLFCERIFGPTRDYECSCGKYKGNRYKGNVCNQCGVEVTEKKVRRERMGHIELAEPVAHTWFFRSNPNKIGSLLDIPKKALEDIIHYDGYVVVQPGLAKVKSKEGKDKELKRGDVLTEYEYQLALESVPNNNDYPDGPDKNFPENEDYKKKFKAGMGAQVLYDMLCELGEPSDFSNPESPSNLEVLARELRERLHKEKSPQKKNDILKRLNVVQAFVTSQKKMRERGLDNRPEWMILKNLPVIPPDLRPLIPLDGGRFANSDINELYRSVVYRNNRLKKLKDTGAPEVIMRNEKRLLQEAVDSLLDNTHKTSSARSDNNRALKSLSDTLKGKQGRFRQNLLGKRVDFSGRSVIVVGPELKMHECGLPKDMAAELFKPFIIRKLMERGRAKTVKNAKKTVERKEDCIWEVLENIIKGHPIMLNRAPTLHRLGIQAFQPKLVEGKAIRLHPLVCTGFNADFDGDQMAVHVPLGNAAILEAQMLMLSTHNILNPANGAPITVPSQDMVLGLYYTTKPRRSTETETVLGEGKCFYSPEEVIIALNEKRVSQNACIRVRLKEFEGRDEYEFVKTDGTFTEVIKDRNGNILTDRDCETEAEKVIYSRTEFEIVRDAEGYPVVDEKGHYIKTNRIYTTVGRVFFNQVVPKVYGYINMVLGKKSLRDIIGNLFTACGNAQTASFLDDIKNMGYRQAFRGGLSFNLGDVLIPAEKEGLIERANAEVDEVMMQYNMGLITNNERYNHVIDIWTNTNNRLTDTLMRQLKSDNQGFNPVYMMYDSGARGSKEQIRQLSGMRGLMAKPQKAGAAGNEIIENPILSNFKEGLSVLEYFISTHGARKGLADTALKTADAGYLTRRLVDVAHDVIINEEDCGTLRGLPTMALKKGDDLVQSLGERILGRTSVHDIDHPVTHELIARAGEELTESICKKIEEAGIEEVEIRSVLTCEAKHGVCAKCYGRNLATGKMVQKGEAVGVIAAQAIGEPGTQLTLRTFHVGGVAGGNIGTTSSLKASYSGRLEIDSLRAVDYKDDNGTEFKVVIGRSAEVRIVNSDDIVLSTALLPYGSKLYKAHNDMIEKGDVVAEWDPYNAVIISEVDGVVRFENLEEGVTYRIESDAQTGLQDKVIIESRVRSKIPTLNIINEDGDILKAYDLPVGAHIGVEDGLALKAGDAMVKIPRSFGKAGDITGGLPRVTELFEARNSSDPAIVAEIDGTVAINPKLKRNNREVSITAKTGERKVYSIPTSKQILAQDQDFVKAGTPLCDGVITPADILAIKGPLKVQEYIVNEVQDVYRLQGVKINDKHFEVIVRQMMRKVEIEDPGDTTYLPQDVINRIDFNETNDEIYGKKVVEDAGGSTSFFVGDIITARQLRDENSKLRRADKTIMKAREAKPATARQVLQGITKAALHTKSFISAASFQETTKVLTEAAINAKSDPLEGMKENVIVGHLIPAGTGLPEYQNIIVGNKDEMGIPRSK